MEKQKNTTSKKNSSTPIFSVIVLVLLALGVIMLIVNIQREIRRNEANTKTVANIIENDFQGDTLILCKIMVDSLSKDTGIDKFITYFLSKAIIHHDDTATTLILNIVGDEGKITVGSMLQLYWWTEDTYTNTTEVDIHGKVTDESDYPLLAYQIIKEYKKRTIGTNRIRNQKIE